jgi:hypothetical protein
VKEGLFQKILNALLKALLFIRLVIVNFLNHHFFEIIFSFSNLRDFEFQMDLKFEFGLSIIPILYTPPWGEFWVSESVSVGELAMGLLPEARDEDLNCCSRLLTEPFNGLQIAFQFYSIFFRELRLIELML